VNRPQVEPYRDHVMAAFPVIEVSCGTLGGMSGGRVLYADGAVTGILSPASRTRTAAGPATRRGSSTRCNSTP
jgi:hypothetical protein